MPSRQLIIFKPGESADGELNFDAMESMGTRREVLEALASCNTAPDTSGGEFLYGPGLTIQMPWGDGDVTQLLMSVVDQEIAWPVLARIRKRTGWHLRDLESGQVF